MQRSSAVLGTPALACLLIAPPASASSVLVGPFALTFDSASRGAALLNPPGHVVMRLTQASGVVSGEPVTNSPAVVLFLGNAPPSGYRFCENLPGGGFRTCGDGTGVIVAA